MVFIGFGKMIRKFFDLFCSPPFFQIDPNREYSNKELIDILRKENLSLNMGNSILLVLIMRMNDKIEELSIGMDK
jgi:hypothetical protein